jgi:hypothetical protein
MARTNPLDFHLSPFGWRVLVPATAKALPFSLQASFLLLTIAATVGTGAALYVLLRRELGSLYGLTGVALLFSMGWGPKYLLSDFWLPDAEAFLLATLGILFAARGRAMPFAFVLLAGAFTKESVLFIAPLFYTLNARRAFDGRLILRTAAVAAPGVVAVVAIRLLIPSQNGDAAYLATLPGEISRFPDLFPPYDYLALARDIGYHQRLEHMGFDTFAAYTYRALGVGPLVFAAAALPSHWRLALRLSPFVLLVYAQTVVATDTERLVVFAFPAVIWLAVAGIPDTCERARVRPEAFLITAGGLFLLTLLSRDSYQVAAQPQIAVIVAGGVGAVLAMRRAARARTG